MSFIDDINIYNDPILSFKRKGTPDSPYKQMIETLTVEDGKVILTEIPNKKQRVVVKNGTTILMETDDNTTLDSNLFYVDYPNGLIYFNSSLSNQSLDFTYLGEGARFFPASRIWLENDTNHILNAKDKFSDIDRLINEQKARVDVQIQSVPQPYEILDMRVDRNGVVYDVAKDRIDAEQLKIDNIRQEINDSYTDLLNNKYTSLKDRFNSIDSEIDSLTQNITSVQDSLTLKVDGIDFTGENIVSKIELTPSNILISANKINLNGAIGINALDSNVYNTVNNAVLKSNLNLTSSLPTAIEMDSNGITAYTSDTTKYARLNQNGLYTKGGAIVVERSDGYKLINNGVANFDFSVDVHDPPFRDPAVTINSWWYQTVASTYKDVNFYSYKHTGRYLRMQIQIGSESGGGNNLELIDFQTGNKLFESLSAGWYIGDGGGLLDITVDLGTPTGALRSFYLRMSAINGVNTYCRVMRKWLEG